MLQSQLCAASSITSELTQLYWRIGKNLSKKVPLEGWGSKTLQRLAKDIEGAFPNLTGFSFRNLKSMRQLAESYPQGIWETAVSQIPWGHNIVLSFAFVGRQYPLDVGGKDFSIDLLFYYVILHCYVVIKLKTHEFVPRDTGQMSFYLSAVDDLIRQSDDKRVSLN
ncbi:MAG: PDDEXK nuclease domain-containing protein [Candidatus Algichlamydia australiensis]|nr:PDDEXK nuclease domain-containing protein [Chlamydiales bacterium]